MYEMKSLEDEWKIYKRKKRKPYLIFGLILSLAIATLSSLEDQKISFDQVTEYIQKFKAFDREIIKVDKENIGESLVVIKPLEKLDTHSTNKESEKPLNILVDIPILDMENNRILEHVKPKKNTVTESPLIDIVGTSSVIAYEEVEQRFNQHHDIDDALFLAKSYYKKGDYEKAAYWALETNKLDDDIEESIFIFVEAKVKSGQVNEGILILKRYIQQSSSDEAKKLLFRIENN